MRRDRLAAPALGALVLGMLLLSRTGPFAAAPAAAGVAPGDLAILGKDGQVAGQCPLKHTAVSADVSGFVGRVTVKQAFRNPSREPVEAVYTFPLPNDAAVDDMTMTVGPRLIKGEIKRREEARQIYEAAKSAGQAAALLDQERPNIFTQAVANLMPGQDVTITISYVQLLKYDAGSYEFSFPMVVGPRYTGTSSSISPQPAAESKVPPAPRTQPVLTDPEKITPPLTPQGTRAGHDISLSVNVDAGFPLQELKSQLHAVTIEKDGANKAQVRLKDEDRIPNRDFILRYTVAGDRMQTGVLAHASGNGAGYFTLILQPPAAPPQQDVSPKEMVFVIDQTGSQRGLPIQKAKETLRYCLENLNPQDTFQLLGFNTQVFPCFAAPVPVAPEHIDRALQFLAPLEGNGGTDILKSVDYALQQIQEDPGRARIICYMTDGYVGNDMQILDYIRKNRGKARMFPFGVGNSVNRFLIDGMAREGRGAAYYVDLNTPGEKAAAKFYQRVAKPLLLDPQVEWNGLPVADVYPEVLPDVFSSGPIILKGRYKGAAKGEITVKGLLRGQAWSQQVAVDLPAKEPAGAAIPTLWAREKIEALQGQDWQGAQSGNPDPKVKEQIVGLALDYRLMSPYTSFVAVEQKVVNLGGRQRTVDIPVEMPAGVSYEGIFGERSLDRLGRAPAQRRAGLQAQQNFYRYAVPNAPAGGSLGGAGGGGFGGSAGRGFGLQGGGAAGAPGPPGPAVAATPRLRVQSEALAKKPAPASTPAPANARGATTLGKPVLEQKTQEAVRLKEIGDKDGAGLAVGEQKPLAQLKPEERRAVLRRVKLAPGLQDLPALLKKEGTDGTLAKAGLPEVRKGQVILQVWLAGLKPDSLAKLKALGFTTVAQLRGKQLLLGTLPVQKLDALLELPFVQWVEVPKFK